MTALRRDTIGEEEYSIEDYGWDDHQLGVRLGDNPFAINNWKYYEWEKGWLLADESKDNEDSSTLPLHNRP